MKRVSTTSAPEPAGHYAQGLVHGGLVYVSGQLGRDPARPGAPVGSPAEQTERALRNVEEVLRAAGSGLDRVLQLTIFISDLSLWGEVNAACAEAFGQHRPTRAIVPVKEFRDGLQVEIQAIAAGPDTT